MTLQDFSDFLQMWTDDPDDEDTVRPATQGDIDRMF